MWSSWFQKGKRSSRPSRLVEGRLAAIQQQSQPDAKESSPTLKELQSQGKKKVQRLSSFFEQNVNTYSEDRPTWFHEDRNKKKNSKKLSFTRLPSIEEPLLPVFDSPPDSPNEVNSIVRKFIAADDEFIASMKFMIDQYVRSFEVVPAIVMSDGAMSDRQKYELFGPIEAIYRFHHTELNPRLVECNGNVERFASKLKLVGLCNIH